MALRPLHRQLHALGLESVPDDRQGQARHLQLHAQGIERAFDDWYAICSCGWMSRGSVSARLAEGSRCPVEAAEGERYRNRINFFARMSV